MSIVKMSVVKQGDYKYTSLISNDTISLELGQKIRAMEQKITDLETTLSTAAELSNGDANKKDKHIKDLEAFAIHLTAEKIETLADSVKWGIFKSKQ